MKTTIKKIGINGEGIAFEKKKPIFISYTLPEEVIEYQITERKPNYSFGEVKKVLHPSPFRVQPECRSFKECGACTFMQVAYPTQLEYKKKLLQETLTKYAKIDPSLVDDVIASTSPLHYRNALKLPFAMKNDKLVIGMYGSNSNRFVRIDHCIIHQKRLDVIKREIVKILNVHHYKAYENANKDGLRYLVMRILENKVQVTIVGGKNDIAKDCIDQIMNIEEVVSLYFSENRTKKTTNIFGKEMIHLGGVKFLNFHFKDIYATLSPRSFFQLNTAQASRLYDVVVDAVADNQECIVEAYCGVGMMSLLLANKAKKVIGIESIPEAIQNAKRNAQRNDIKNTKFMVGDAGTELIKLSAKQPIDTLVVDPPRSGLDDVMLDCIMKSDIQNIVYVSCNPATLAKNLAVLQEAYAITKITPVDMFSQTAHVETVVLMSRVEK
ncbi:MULTISPECIES: 23S rRNA (uracil(1939)-C(5))-methyltransferase RlmD [unclassified Breznakia]|uniref:23S rRNA (uracil(1939)-C(5))-methyltransferase RlmD n=1 Tax=unclassified Breznakia TaxID=2623764 RepID=UPI002475A0FF|nr:MULTISPECIES: 23S rRNA (uracil(1939)-C(5))-methyltransferase RlmD [unclassified Breznakia]MDH6367967.1 23S rRNA (uracil1939-C5)-methyltransferase [Breznakia sp. PH1-1]MDH6405055.1 23S rRNA (uracil1939-C5)-methyltransferase [Breznakia sp. PF1-11]MDH6412776.1 23S rRNA (uracil1939-C5)-methyltransferase [Breznakia sp. PFB1-11]MDH6415130.1 23S rRNA (uracil1939-C5)-methyltransferase [Breznakia sp. PFB1-14]MDH6417447.1 23S rRNA (uracil1939-C5)-methyltransferase [Breznakia sp. PFB1-4]